MSEHRRGIASWSISRPIGTLMLTDQFFRLNIEAQRLTRALGLNL